jgi:hypothetical protein
MSTTVETIIARLESDTQQFQQGFSQAAQQSGQLDRALRTVTGASTVSTHAMTTLRRGLVGLAMTATQTSGPVGQLSQALLLFGGGGALVLGVAAGIAALALAYRAFTKDTRENTKAQEELIKQLQGVGVHAKLTAAQIELAALRAKALQPQTVGEVASQFLSDMTGGRLGTSRDEQKQQIQRDIAASLIKIAALTREVAKWEKGIADDAERTRREHEKSLEALKKMVTNAKMFKDAIETAVDKVAELATGAKQRAVEAFRLDFVDRTGKTATTKQLIEASFEPSEMQKALHDLGLSAGKQFALGIIEGIESMQDLLKSILIQFLSLGLDALFGRLFGPAKATFSSGGSGKGFKGFEPSIVSPASFSLNLGTLPAPTTPFAVMRDADWLRYLTGSLIQARARGFRK